MMGLVCVAFAQNTGNNERYNLAVYAVGLQNDQPISASLLTVVQNKTITKLTGEGNYRLIERSNEFLRQIQNEQTMQQSGEVADGQIAEIGAGLGAQKICVVSITIIDKYLYIATRIVDVATKTLYESGDAEVKNYKSNDIPLLTQTLERALNNMMAASSKTGDLPVTPVKPVESPKPTTVPQTVPSQPATPQVSDHISTSQNGNSTVAEVRAEMERAKAEKKAEKTNLDVALNAYKRRLNTEKGGFLEVNSLAHKEYKTYKLYKSIGITLIAICSAAALGVGIYDIVAGYNYLIAVGPVSFAGITTGIVLLGTMNKHLKKSYQYYLNGDQRAATLQFYPYYGSNNAFGAGLTLRF